MEIFLNILSNNIIILSDIIFSHTILIMRTTKSRYLIRK